MKIIKDKPNKVNFLGENTMGYLDNSTVTVDAILTKQGRKH